MLAIERSYMTTPLDHPPRPKLVFRVGVTGRRFAHHSITSTPALEARVHEVIGQVKAAVEVQAKTFAEFYSPEPPVLRVVSSLAEGADQLVARIALEAGFELQCALPFPEAAYRAQLRGTEADRRTAFGQR